MRKLLLSLILAAACGGSTDPKPAPLGELRLVVLPSTDAQAGAAGDELPKAVEVVVGREPATSRTIVALSSGPGDDTLITNLTPVPNAIVSFVVLDAACGRPFAGSALTDATGHAKERWILGTVARECVMEARLVNQTTGAPVVVDRITATVTPGPATSLSLAASAGTTQQTAIPVTAGQSLDLASWTPTVKDGYGNLIASPSYENVFVPGLDPLPATWTAGSVGVVPSTPGTYRAHLRVAGSTQAINFRWVRVP